MPVSWREKDMGHEWCIYGYFMWEYFSLRICKSRVCELGEDEMVRILINRLFSNESLNTGGFICQRRCTYFVYLHIHR